MGSGKSPKNTSVLALGGTLIVVAVGIIVTRDATATPIQLAIRAGAILGYLAVFFTSLSSLYMRELTRFFGRPFLKLHHIVAITGLVMLVLHAGGIALESSTLRTFLPRFDSLEVFLQLGGRPAFWLIAIASLAALFRSSLGKKWQVIHWLNYLAFLLGTIHAQLIGTNFQNLGMKIASSVLALVLIGVFVQKRIQKQGRKKTEKTIKPQEEKEANS